MKTRYVLLGLLLGSGVAWLLGPEFSMGQSSPAYSGAATVGDVGQLPVPIVFVSRQIPPDGTIYWKVPRDLPGAGPYSRFRVAAPGRLMILSPSGELRTLIDGANPSPASLRLIDVSAPDVSYDGKQIVFAGFPLDQFDPVADTQPLKNPNAWRLYVIGVDGKGLHQLTFSGPKLNYSQFGLAANGLQGYDDTDPAWLPDGRIVFSSTRWPSFAQYSAARTSNLYVINADGSALHRITAERNGADRPVVDPLTGKIVYARWWRNHRFAMDSMETIPSPSGGFIQKDGLTIDRVNHVGGSDNLWRNQWHAATINPDGTGLALWTRGHHASDSDQFYGGAFTPAGDLASSYFPMDNMSEASGFGGIRLFRRGFESYQPIIGVTDRFREPLNPNPPSFQVFPGNYATEPEVLPDKRFIISWCKNIDQDYGLYFVDPNGRGLTPLFDNSGTSELSARLIQSRPLPPILRDTVPLDASTLPPLENGPYDQDGTFAFDALNVYFNGDVDTIAVNAPAAGSAATIRFFLDAQRTNPGSFATLDWPVLLGERVISPDGAVLEPRAPANLPLFEQIRSNENTVPLTRGGMGGAAHVAGMNFGRPGQVARCVGCHVGHTAIPVPARREDARWTNLAPGAEVQVSSSRDPTKNRGLVDRRVLTGNVNDYWSGEYDKTENQWAKLTFLKPVTIRTVRLYNPRSGGEPNSSIQVLDATVRLYANSQSSQPVAFKSTGKVLVSGTDVAFDDVVAQVAQVNIGQVTGTFNNHPGVSLAEIEVIGRAGTESSVPFGRQHLRSRRTGSAIAR